MSLLDRLDSLYRAKFGKLSGLAERGIMEQDALDDLRRHTGFAALIDVFEAELRHIWRQWLATQDEIEILRLQARARVISDMIRTIDKVTTAKQRAEEAEAESQRQADLSRVDGLRQRQALAGRARFQHHVNTTA